MKKPRKRRTFGPVLILLWGLWILALPGLLYVAWRMSDADGALGFLGVLCAMLPLWFWWPVGKRLIAMSAALRPRQGDRSKFGQIVLLRPFELDRELNQRRSEEPESALGEIAGIALNVFTRKPDVFPSQRNRSSFQEALAEAVNREIGNLISLGNPADVLPSTGGSRIYASDDDWQGIVRDIVGRARCILLFAGESPGLRWELSFLKESASPECVFLLTLPAAATLSEVGWTRQCQIFAGAGWTMPEDDPGPGCVLALMDGWRATVIASGLESAEQIMRVIKRRLENPESLPVAEPVTADVESISSHNDGPTNSPGPALRLIICPFCSARVVVTLEEMCPSCRQPIEPGHPLAESADSKDTSTRRAFQHVSDFERWKRRVETTAWGAGFSGALLVLSSIAVVLVPGWLLYESGVATAFAANLPGRSSRLVPLLLGIPLAIPAVVWFHAAAPIFYLLFRIEKRCHHQNRP